MPKCPLRLAAIIAVGFIGALAATLSGIGHILGRPIPGELATVAGMCSGGLVGWLTHKNGLDSPAETHTD